MTKTKKPHPKVSSIRRVAIAAVALIVTLWVVPTVRAIIEVPSTDDIFFQTSGEQTPLNIGDAYSFNGLGGDNTHHLVEINIPCLPNQVFRVELFDPEAYENPNEAPGTGTETVDDEVRPQAPGTPVGDETNFVLTEPNNTIVVASATFGPYPQFPAAAPPEHNNWVAFATINLPAAPVDGDTCGNYSIEVWTGDESGTADINNDDNAWKYRILGGPGAVGVETFDPTVGPDGRQGTGDEAALGIQRLSFQHNTGAAQNFFWFVDDVPNSTWIGHNFDIDIGTSLCAGVTCTIVYEDPSGMITNATLSGNSVWNPGQATRLGDTFNNAEPGLWQANVEIPVNNQYIIEIENSGKPIFLEEPVLPQVTITKDDGVTLVQSPGVTTYTLTIANISDGGAMSVAGPEVIDTLPPNTTFAGCAIDPPLNGACQENPPGSGTVQFDLVAQTAALNTNGSTFGSILAYLPGVSSNLVNTGTLRVSVNIASGLTDGTLLTNTVQIDWTDIYRNNYRPERDDDTDIVQAAPTPTLTPTPTSTPTSPPDDGGDSGSPPPTSPPGSTPSTPAPPSTPGAPTPTAISLAVPGATPTVLPVTFLPETGTKERFIASKLLLLILLGVAIAVYLLWARLKKRDLSS